MNNLIYQEVRTANQEIRQLALEKPDEAAKLNIELFDTIATIDQLSNAARRNGLFYIEDMANDLDASSYGSLKDLISLIMDGTDPDYIEEISFLSYFAEDAHDYQALKHIISYVGALSIQQGYNPIMTEIEIMHMLPSNLRADYNAWKSAKEAREAEINRDVHKEIPDEFEIESPSFPSPFCESDPFYFQARMFEFTINSLDDKSIQRILQDTENTTLAKALKGCASETQDKFFRNISVRLATLIHEDMDYMGPIKLSTVAQAMMDIYKTAVKLLNCGVITAEDDSAILAFAQIFEIEQLTNEQSQELSKANQEIESLLQEYLNNVYKKI